MRFKWQPHWCYPVDLSQAHHNSYSILWSKTPQGRFLLGGAQYEVSLSLIDIDDDICRFNTRRDMEKAIERKSSE